MAVRARCRSWVLTAGHRVDFPRRSDRFQLEILSRRFPWFVRHTGPSGFLSCEPLRKKREGCESAIRRSFAVIGSVLTFLALPQTVFAWGAEGHKIIALIASSHLTPTARAKLSRLLAEDQDPLTPKDLPSRAVWADRYRESHRETAPWHFAEIEMDGSRNIAKACGAQGVSRGCVVDELNYFEGILSDAQSPRSDQLMAYKFVLHLAGDIGQPLHVAGDHDSGGNCVHVSYNGLVHSLHEFWDDETVRRLGRDPVSIAEKLDETITPEAFARAQRGGPADWAQESHELAVEAYSVKTAHGCVSESSAVTLSDSYVSRATQIAAAQLQQSGVRLAMLLNRALR